MTAFGVQKRKSPPLRSLSERPHPDGSGRWHHAPNGVVRSAEIPTVLVAQLGPACRRPWLLCLCRQRNRAYGRTLNGGRRAPRTGKLLGTALRRRQPPTLMLG